MSDLTLLFWTSILILAYTYLGYPALIWLWAKLRPRPLCTGRLEPKVTVLVVAYNEGRRIVERLENLLTLDYPKELLEVILASDGSTDDTVERARAFRQAGVTIAVFRTRRGTVRPRCVACAGQFLCRSSGGRCQWRADPNPQRRRDVGWSRSGILLAL